MASIVYGALDLTNTPYLWEFGGDLGKPEMVTTALRQQLQDGEIVTSERASNRKIVLTILVEGDLASQATAEAALALECAKVRNTLTYTPDDAPVTVFDTFAADMEFKHVDEMDQQNLRRWVLTIPALPYPRTDELVSTTIAAPPASVLTTEVDACASTTGWAIGAQTGSAVENIYGSTTWTCPVGVSAVTAELLGGGGGGGAGGGTTPGGGGGGGAYAATSGVAVVAGTGYAVTVGSGGQAASWPSSGGASSFGPNTVLAVGGSGGSSDTTGGAGGNAASCVGATRTSGSNGGNGWYTGGPVRHGGAGGAGAPPLTDGYYGYGGRGEGDDLDGTGGNPGRARLTYSGSWAIGVSNGIKATKSPPAGQTTTLTRTGLAVAMAGKPYIRVTTAWEGTPGTLAFSANGVARAILSQSGGVYYIDGSGITTLNSLAITITAPAAGQAAFLHVQNVSITNSQTPGSTGRENSRQVAVAGSARAIASLSLADSGAALGTAVVYTTSVSNAFQPNLKAYMVAGPVVTPDGNTISGGTTPLSTQHWFDIPSHDVPEAGYLLLVRIQHATVGAAYTIGWSARSRMGGADVGDVQSGSVDITLVAGTWTFATIALPSLPATKVGQTGYVRVGLTGPAGVILDEAWLFDLYNGRVSWVECGTSRRLWLDTASSESPLPGVWRGTAADRSDAIHAGVDTRSWGQHEFVPPITNVFTVTASSTGAALTLSYYPRWHTHVGSVTP